jgi:hypothetical protein
VEVLLLDAMEALVEEEGLDEELQLGAAAAFEVLREAEALRQEVDR